MIEVGSKVKCIDATIPGHTLLELSKDMPEWVTQDEEYIIRGINDNKGIVTGFLLEGVENPKKYFRLVDSIQEPAFASWRFRKIEEAYVDPFELEETNVVELDAGTYEYDNYKLAS